MKIAFVLALIGMAAAMPKKEIETLAFPGRNPGRIVGGVEAAMNEFPFIVDMRRPSHYCAGSIISEEWVVTAAHCSLGAPSAYTLTAGDHNIANSDGTEQTRQVVQIIVHPQYGSPLQYQNDIALMKVEPPFVFNANVSAVILPDLDFDPTAVATVTGWGALSQGGPSPDVLMKVDVPYVDDATCNVAYSGSIADSMICYGEAGKDSCQGDSGGPIVCGADKSLCGIVSWGQGCALPGYPGVYTETSHYRNWIRDAITPHVEDPTPVVTVTTCGGLVESSSAAINFNLGSAITPNQRCVWTIKGPYDSLRLGLKTSGLTTADGLYVTKYDSVGPGQQFRLTDAGDDFNLSGGIYLLTFIAGPSAGSQGFSVEFYSSGFGDSTPAFSGYASLNATTGTYSYPEGGGQYRNGENAVFVVNPAVAGDRTVTFSRVDIENDSQCSYDAVAVFIWSNNQYLQSGRFCGSSIPAPFQAPGGLALVTFTTDSSVTATGFTFGWQ
jgi:secreted trypsin-like serine protease